MHNHRLVMVAVRACLKEIGKSANHLFLCRQWRAIERFASPASLITMLTHLIERYRRKVATSVSGTVRFCRIKNNKKLTK